VDQAVGFFCQRNPSPLEAPIIVADAVQTCKPGKLRSFMLDLTREIFTPGQPVLD
jgi:hypothetical protein